MYLKKYHLKVTDTDIKYDGRKSINDSMTASKVLIDYYKEYSEEKEKYVVLFLNNQNKIIGIDEVSVGTIDKTVVHAREVFRKAIMLGCTKIITAHNHPSGSLTPSVDDFKTNKAMVEAGNILRIEVLDNFIIASDKSFSFKQNNLMDIETLNRMLSGRNLINAIKNHDID